MKLAFPNASGDIFVLDEMTLRCGMEASRESPRRRMIFPIHRHQEDLVQRMLNFLQPNTYLIPHVHPQESASETIFVIQGSIGFITMNQDGTGLEPIRVDKGGLLDIVPGVWHTLVVLAEDTVILEIKKGPYLKEDDKHFAPWAPDESDPSSRQLLAQYEALFGRF